jgi:hypothetical protein
VKILKIKTCKRMMIKQMKIKRKKITMKRMKTMKLMKFLKPTRMKKWAMKLNCIDRMRIMIYSRKKRKMIWTIRLMRMK